MGASGRGWTSLGMEERICLALVKAESSTGDQVREFPDVHMRGQISTDDEDVVHTHKIRKGDHQELDLSGVERYYRHSSN